MYFFSFLIFTDYIQNVIYVDSSETDSEVIFFCPMQRPIYTRGHDFIEDSKHRAYVCLFR